MLLSSLALITVLNPQIPREARVLRETSLAVRRLDAMSQTELGALFESMRRRAKPVPYSTRFDLSTAGRDDTSLTYDMRAGSVSPDTYHELPAMPELDAADNQIKPRTSVGIERIRIGDSSKFPWTTNCKLFILFPNGQVYGGSGTLISDHHVVTAAHNLFSHQLGGWATSILVAPGYNRGPAPFGYTFVVASQLSRDFIATPNSINDYAVVALKAPIGRRAGWLDFGHIQGIVGAKAHNVSYPVPLDAGRTPWYVSGPVDAATGEIIETRFDSDKGASGSGIYMSPGGRRRVFGTLIGYVPGINKTIFCRINPYREMFIRDFMKRH